MCEIWIHVFVLLYIIDGTWICFIVYGYQVLPNLFVIIEIQNFILTHPNCMQAFTAENVLAKFEKARYALLESLHQLEETLPEAASSQVATGYTRICPCRLCLK
jgi:hypothetical protein